MEVNKSKSVKPRLLLNRNVDGLRREVERGRGRGKEVEKREGETIRKTNAALSQPLFLPLSSWVLMYWCGTCACVEFVPVAIRIVYLLFFFVWKRVPLHSSALLNVSLFCLWCMEYMVPSPSFRFWRVWLIDCRLSFHLDTSKKGERGRRKRREEERGEREGRTGEW